MGSIWDDRLAEVWAPPGKAGSGVVIGTCGVLTARHVIDAVATGAQTGPVLARVIRRGSPPPTWVPMRIAGEDAAWDLAVLHVDQEAPEAAGWVRPVSGSPVVVTVGGSSERDCESVGFPDEEVQRPAQSDPAGWVRQSEQLLGTLLPMGQARPPVLLSGTLPREWMPLDAQTAAPDVQSWWRGMSGAGVVLPDGRLAGVAVAAEDRHQQRRLYVVPLASALAQSARLAMALADAAGAPVVAETRFAPMYRRLLYPATLRTDGSPVRFDEVADLGVLGVKPVDLPGEPPNLTYVPRDDDPTLIRQLHEAAAAKRMLLVTGYSGSGKSRSAAHAVCQAYPAHRLLRPLEDRLAALVDLPLADLAPAVVWLDDVEKYQHSALAETLTKLLSAGLVLVGTIRLGPYRALTQVDGSRAEFRNPVGEALSDERLVRQLDWKRDWSQSERDRAADYVTNRLARAAVRKGLSLSVWAVAGPELVKQLKYIRADEDAPCRYALVRAVLDWHHTGVTSPIPWPVAVDLVNHAYLDHPASDDDLTDAVNQATRPIGIGGRRGRYSLLTRQQGALTANDYIQDWDGRHPPSPIPEATWQSAIANAPSFDSLWNIGFTAHFEGQTAVEQTAMQTLANADAMVGLGLLLRDRDPAAARAWWERAAAAGNTNAGANLEVLLADYLLYEPGQDPKAAWGAAIEAWKQDRLVHGLGELDGPDLTESSLTVALEAVEEYKARTPPYLHGGLKMITKALTALREFTRAASFEDKETALHTVMRCATALSTEIRNAPTALAVEAVAPVAQLLSRLAERESQALLEANPPRPRLEPALARGTIAHGVFTIQVNVSNEEDSAPLESAVLRVVPDTSSLIPAVRPIALPGPVRGGTAHVVQIRMPLARALPVSPVAVPIALSYRPRFGSAGLLTRTVTFGVMPPESFTEVQNPYLDGASGVPVTSREMFFGRDEFIDQVRGRIRKAAGPGAGVAIFGQKRSGKSSIRVHLVDRLRKLDGFPVVDVGNIGDLTPSSHESDPKKLLAILMWRIIEGAEKDRRSETPFLPPNLRREEFVASPDPVYDFAQLFIDYRAAAPDIPPFVVCLDEFQYIEGWIRDGLVPPAIMQMFKALVERRLFHLVIVGQSDLERLVRDDPNVFGVFTTARVSYLTALAARRLIEVPIQMDGQSRYRGRAVDRILELTGGNAFYIQRICSALVDYMNDHGAPLVTEADVDLVSAAFLGRLTEADFDNLESHGRDGFTTTENRAVLLAVARALEHGQATPESIAEEYDGDRLQEILRELAAHEVIRRDRGAYQIVVGIYRDWLIKFMGPS